MMSLLFASPADRKNPPLLTGCFTYTQYIACAFYLSTLAVVLK